MADDIPPAPVSTGEESAPGLVWQRPATTALAMLERAALGNLKEEVCGDWRLSCSGEWARAALAQLFALLAAAEAAAPIPMVLHCPRCDQQHIDAPVPAIGWTNPPHRSHLCHGCGCIWRPADLPTIGVAAIATRGKADTWPLLTADCELPTSDG
jgi:hypothetical protein